MLPIRTTLDDVRTICRFLVTKPTGATREEALTVLDSKYLDGRKLSAMKSWGLVDDDDGRLKITDDGRRLAKDDATGLVARNVFQQVIRRITPYNAVLERAAHRQEGSLSTTDVAAHWYEHFRAEASESDKTLNDQAVCFFHLVDGAALGQLTIGRQGAPTRIDLNPEELQKFVGVAPETVDEETARGAKPAPHQEVPMEENQQTRRSETPQLGSRRVFITHGKNKKVLEQLKEIVTYGKLVPVVAQEHETTSKPVPEKVMDDMRSCFAGVIHVSPERVIADGDGGEQHVLNENVLIEIGAAMALYRKNVILLVEQGVRLPSNLQGLYACRYEGDKLDGDATMKLLKAFNDFSTPTA